LTIHFLFYKIVQILNICCRTKNNHVDWNRWKNANVTNISLRSRFRDSWKTHFFCHCVRQRSNLVV